MNKQMTLMVVTCFSLSNLSLAIASSVSPQNNNGCSITIVNDESRDFFIEVTGQTDFKKATIAPKQSHEFKALSCHQDYQVYGYTTKKTGNFSVTYKGVTPVKLNSPNQSINASTLDLKKEPASGEFDAWQ